MAPRPAILGPAETGEREPGDQEADDGGALDRASRGPSSPGGAGAGPVPDAARAAPALPGLGEPGAALVLLHGGQGNARQWDTVARALADRSRVLAPDLRGHGESDHAPDGDYAPDVVAGDVEALADALGLGRFALVGFSIGGHAAYINPPGTPTKSSGSCCPSSSSRRTHRRPVPT